jgi:NAD(P)-dependent dehydrogenase (short-subunit alcohol dehydrogenase family)
VTERLAVVVGAGGGIGGACARALAAGRDGVLCVDLSAANVARIATTITQAGARAYPLLADAAAEDFSARVLNALPVGAHVTAAVHAVAYEEHRPALEVSRQSMLRSFAAGPLAAFTVFRDLLRSDALAPGAALTAIGSLHATYPFADCLGYNAAHGALAQVVRTLAHEWAGRGVRVNAVVPGWIRTDAEVEFYGVQHLDRVSGSLPLGRFGSADDIAHAVEFISSDRASYVSGSLFTVDGALSASLARLTDGGDR